MNTARPRDKATRIAPLGARRGERGAVLLTVLLVMVGLLGLGMTALWLTGGNMQIGSNQNFRQQALYVAEMGLELVIADANGFTDVTMNPLINPTSALPTGCPRTDRIPTNANQVNDPQSWPGAVYRRGGVLACDMAFPPGGLGADAGVQSMGRFTVYIRNDKNELLQGMYTSDVNNFYILRSEARIPYPNDPNNASISMATVVLERPMGPFVGGGSPSGSGPGTVLGYSGKNAQEDNTSVEQGVVIQ